MKLEAKYFSSKEHLDKYIQDINKVEIKKLDFELPEEVTYKPKAPFSPKFSFGFNPMHKYISLDNIDDVDINFINGFVDACKKGDKTYKDLDILCSSFKCKDELCEYKH